MSRFPRRQLLGFFVICVVAFGASGDKLDRWKRELTGIDQQLKTGQFADAREKTLRLTRWMMEGLGGGPDAMYTLAVTSSFRALAEAGLGNRDEAEWYWHVAVALFPKFHGSNLGVYREAGAFVANIDRELNTLPADAADDSDVEMPVAIERVRPTYPRGAIEQGIGQPIVVDVVIGSDGLPRKPRIPDTGWEPSLAFATLEALKNWRFKPATRNGEVVAVRMQLTMSFSLKYR